jgi:hypothetical protein
MFDNRTANLPTKLTTTFICPSFSKTILVVPAGSESLEERHNRLFYSAIGWSLLLSHSFTLYSSKIPISTHFTQTKQFGSYPEYYLATHHYKLNVDSYLFAVISQRHQTLTQYLKSKFIPLFVCVYVYIYIKS